MRLKLVDNVFEHGLEQIELRARRMTVNDTVRLHEGNRRQFAVIQRAEEVDRILDVLGRSVALPMIEVM